MSYLGNRSECNEYIAAWIRETSRTRALRTFRRTLRDLQSSKARSPHDTTYDYAIEKLSRAIEHLESGE